MGLRPVAGPRGATAERFGVRRWFTDFMLMLDEPRPEIVDVATPPGSYYQFARCCVGAGANVPCEKPITVEYEQFQNGDWPAHERRRESRFLSCDGLVCTNPLFYARNRKRWFSALIPNGVDPARFHPGPGDRTSLGLPRDRPVVAMASALVETKRVLEGIRAVSTIPEAFLVVAGDGPLRHDVDVLAAKMLPGRFLRTTLPHDRMPDSCTTSTGCPSMRARRAATESSRRRGRSGSSSAASRMRRSWPTWW